MIINKKIISKLNPCKDRFDNYLTHYNNKNFTVKQFMGLKNITHEDKLWVAFRLLPKDKIRFAAADIAELVLHIYEEAYPGDLRPRKAIEAARGFDLANAATSAANAATSAANAANAASYAANAATSAANAATSAANAASYAANAASYAANAANVRSPVKNRNLMEKRQRTILIKYLKEIE